MKIKSIHVYVGLISGVSIFALATLPWADIAHLPTDHLIGLLLLLGFSLLCERLTVGMKFLPNSGQTITFIPLLAAVMLFGPTAPVLTMGTTGAVAEIFFRRKEAIRAVFNISQYVLATVVAGWSYAALGGVANALNREFSIQFLPFFAFLVTFIWVNYSTVSVAIILSEGLPFRRAWRRFVWPWGASALYDVLISPLAIVVVFFYSQSGWIGLLFALFPLLFIRLAYLNTYRLEQVNQDLLKALVKAIEVRDPYTSGHSQRVAGMAARIARNLGLSSRRVERVETAALLHDVGKIDSVYSEILRKPESLTEDERRIIELHVTKGVEILRSLASVPEEIIAAVRHHHEREDGAGYPDRIRGDEIPLGAKIIKVCDAIDAMLSDRPYRAALTLEQVREQLVVNAGTEFDVSVVSCVLRSGMLLEHSLGGQRGDHEGAPEFPKRPLVGRWDKSKRLAVLS